MHRWDTLIEKSVFSLNIWTWKTIKEIIRRRWRCSRLVKWPKYLENIGLADYVAGGFAGGLILKKIIK